MKRFLLPIFGLILAAGVQGNFPNSLTILGAKPDLILVVLIAYALAEDLIFGAMLGFVAGLIHGSVVGLNMGSFILTRTITGFLAGIVTTRLFSENYFVPVISAAWLTLVCEGLFILANPRIGLFAAARMLIGECIYNAIFTLIIYCVLKNFYNRHKVRLANARL